MAGFNLAPVCQAEAAMFVSYVLIFLIYDVRCNVHDRYNHTLVSRWLPSWPFHVVMEVGHLVLSFIQTNKCNKIIFTMEIM